MYYAIIAEDAADAFPARRAARAAHLKRIQVLVDAGRVLLAGPHPTLDTAEPGEAGFSGSLIVAEFDSLEDAKAWAAGDPYTEAGVFASVTVKPFLPVLP